MSPRTIKITREKFAAVTQFSPELFPENMEIIEDYMMGVWVGKMSKRFPCRIVAEAEWPATWWDAVKERWFPAWLERRYPVRRRGVVIRELYVGLACPSDLTYYHTEAS